MLAWIYSKFTSKPDVIGDPHQRASLRKAYGKKAEHQLLGPLDSAISSTVDTDYYLPDEMIVDFLRSLPSEHGPIQVIQPGYAQFTDHDGNICVLERLRSKVRLIEKYQSAGTLLWPVCFDPGQITRAADEGISPQGHWILLVLTRPHETAIPLFECQIMDGCNYYVDDIPEFLKEIARQLVQAITDESSLTFQSKQIPAQKNGYDCGPAVCYAAQQTMRNKPCAEDIDYTKFRQDIFKALVQDLEIDPPKKRARIK